MPNDAKPLDPDQARGLAQVRRFMMIASVTTFVAIAVVFGVIGYKVYKLGDTAAAPAPAVVDVTAALPAGARVLSTAFGADRIMVTLDVGGATEIRSFDAVSLKPLGRLRLEPKP